MQKSPKELAQAINHSLDELGAPIPIKERSAVLSKILDISRQQAWTLLEGHTMPDKELLARIASELEIQLTE